MSGTSRRLPIRGSGSGPGGGDGPVLPHYNSNLLYIVVGVYVIVVGLDQCHPTLRKGVMCLIDVRRIVIVICVPR